MLASQNRLRANWLLLNLFYVFQRFLGDTYFTELTEDIYFHKVMNMLTFNYFGAVHVQ